MAQAQHWIQAARLRTLPLALACIGMGGILAYRDGVFDATIFSLTLLTAFLLQVLSNFANDYGDSMNGADSSQRTGPSRAVQSGKISAQAMRNAVIIFALLALVSGISLLVIAFQSWQEWAVFLGVGLVCILAAITYTVGDNPYGYAGLGDISVFLFFGLVAVLGTYYLQTKDIPLINILPAISCGLFSVGVLNVNNIRDIVSDKEAGKYSLPVRLGRKNAVIYHWLLLLVAWDSMLVFTYTTYCSLWEWLYLLTAPLFFINARAVKIYKNAHSIDPYLKQMALSTLLFTLFFGVGQFLTSC